MATYQRSKSAAGFCRFQMMYHWLFSGSDVAPAANEGPSCIVNTNFLVPEPRHGSETNSWRMFTRGSGGVFGGGSLSLPSAFRSVTAKSFGRPQVFGENAAKTFR